MTLIKIFKNEQNISYFFIIIIILEELLALSTFEDFDKDNINNKQMLYAHIIKITKSSF